MRPRMELHRWACGLSATIALLLCTSVAAYAATLLPNGKQQFIDGNGVPAAGGSVYMFTPNTSVCKNTWQDAAQATLNACPIILDANGEAIIYGVGTYRQQVYKCTTPPTQCDSSTGTLLYDQLTTDTSASNSVFWAGQAVGTPNAITVVDAGFNGTDGSVIQFVPLSSNTGATTLNPSAFGAIAVVKDTSTGAVALTGGEIVAGSPSNVVSVVYSATQGNFHILNLPNSQAATTPQTLCGAIGLKITNDSTSPNIIMDVRGDQVTSITTGGQTISRIPGTPSVNFTVNGANGLDTGTIAASTWYHIWVIDNGSAGAVLGSLSATAPTMPNGYSYKCRLGAVRTDGSSNLLRTTQLGNHTQYTVTTGTNVPALPAMASGTAGTYSATVPSYAAVAVGSFVPPTATRINLVVTGAWKGGASSAIQLAPNNNYAGLQNASGNVPFFDSNGNSGVTVTNSVFSLEMMLESTNIYWTSNGAGGALLAAGWTDKVNAN
jgi:hypothetical protein